MLITGCDSPLAWYLAKKLDDLGFTVYAGFNTPIDESDEAKILKEETSGRMKLLHLDVSSEKSVSSVDSARRSFCTKPKLFSQTLNQLTVILFAAFGGSPLCGATLATRCRGPVGSGTLCPLDCPRRIGVDPVCCAA